MELAAECAGGAVALEEYAVRRPDAVVVDLRAPGASLAFITALRAAHPGARVLAVVDSDTDERLRAVVQGGGAGRVLADTRAAGVPEALRTLHAQWLAAPAAPADEPDTKARVLLSERERAVLELVARGLNNRAIGESLSISAATVKYHLRNIFSKLDVSDRTKAAVEAVRRGILGPR
jgi:two-component system NarL family response regulator